MGDRKRRWWRRAGIPSPRIPSSTGCARTTNISARSAVSLSTWTNSIPTTHCGTPSLSAPSFIRVRLYNPRRTTHTLSLLRRMTGTRLPVESPLPIDAALTSVRRPCPMPACIWCRCHACTLSACIGNGMLPACSTLISVSIVVLPSETDQ